MSRFKAPFEKLLIDENHNNVRTPKTIAKIFLFIRKYAVERIISKDKTASNFNRKNKSSQAIEVVSGRLRASLPNCENKFITRLPRVSSLKKGIERVNMDTMQPNEHYGIWVSSKLKCDSTRVEKKTEDYVKLLNRDPRFQIGNLRTNFHQSAFNNQSVNQSPLNKHSPYQSIYTTYYPTETFTPERSAASKGSKTTKPEFVLSHASYL